MKFVVTAAATLLAGSAASAQTVYVEPGPPVYGPPGYVELAPRYVLPPPEALVTERAYVVRRPVIVVRPRTYVTREYVSPVIVAPY